MDTSRLRILPRRTAAGPAGAGGRRAAAHAARPADSAPVVAPAAAGEPLDPRVIEAYVAVVRERVAVGADELEALVAARLGLDPAAPATAELFDAVDDELAFDPASPVAFLQPDLLVYAPALTADAVLTHRLSAAELAEDLLDIDTDLAGFLRCEDPRVAAGPLEVDEEGVRGPVRWSGPRGWLAPLPLDALLAVRAAQDGAVSVSVVDAEPVAPPGLVDLLRAVYDAEVAEPGLPVTAESLVLGMLHRDRTAFAEPRPPLTELAAAAGLEQRGQEFAHDAAVWASGEAADREFRVAERLETAEQCAAALDAVAVLDGDEHDARELRRVLELLGDPDVLVAAVEEILGDLDAPEPLARLVAMADRLVAVAGRSPRAAVARWIAAVAAERDGRVLDAESHLRAAAVEADGWGFTEDRLAWYEADRGDAAAAVGRWRSIDTPEDDPDVRAASQVAALRAAGGPVPGRNDPCWCGSGRKFKQCHLGRPATVPLPERVDWLHRKAAAYLERRGGAAEADVLEAAETYAGWDGDVEAAMDDPLVVDVVLHEGGWAARFLAERGPLLPADELQLGLAWLQAARTVVEVHGSAVRDLRTGDRLEITGPVPAGAVLCTRVLPDGAGGHRLAGGTIAVPRGRERELLDLLEDADALELLAWVAELPARN